MEYHLKAPMIPGYSPIEQILNNRGIQNIYHYLHTTDDDILEPSTIMNIKNGAIMLVQHINNNDKILIQIDSDCDGYTSAAALINYLHKICPAFVENNISYRVHEGKQHGILLDSIDDNIKLVIAPDSSSNDYEEHKQLKERGIDVLVIDHHEADKISQYACIINNQLCDYPTKSLSGVGMVYKFCSYLDELMNITYADDLLDLVALGLIADMMDLRDYETKRLIDKGLNHIINPFVRTMINRDAFHFSNGITPIDVAFYIAPLVNAVTRVGTEEEKLVLFESMLDFKGYELIPSTKRGCSGSAEPRVEQACRNCTNIKNRQTRTRDATLETIETLIKTNNLLNNKLLVIQLDNISADRNLTGLIANQLMSKYQRPVLILNKVFHNDGAITWEGSGRGYDKSSLKDFRQFCQDTGLVMYAEGHPNAFGCGITDDKIQLFITVTNEVLKNVQFIPSYTVDFIYHNIDVKPEDITDIATLKNLWGQGIEEALIALEDVPVTAENLNLMAKDKNPTLKITLPNKISIIKFKSSEEEFEKLYTEHGKVSINIIGRCSINEWNGIITPQILVEDYEIVSRSEYYF